MESVTLEALVTVGRICIETWGKGASERKPKATLEG